MKYIDEIYFIVSFTNYITTNSNTWMITIILIVFTNILICT